MLQGGQFTLSETVQKIENILLHALKIYDNLFCDRKMLNNHNCRIDWTKSATEIHNLVRRFKSRPVAYTTLNGKKFKWQNQSNYRYGTILFN